jgi:hypothetical protein
LRCAADRDDLHGQREKAHGAILSTRAVLDRLAALSRAVRSIDRGPKGANARGAVAAPTRRFMGRFPIPLAGPSFAPQIDGARFAQKLSGVCRCRPGGGAWQSSRSRQQPRSLKLAGPRVIPARPALARPRRPAARGRRGSLRAGQTPWGRRIRAMARPAGRRRRRRSTTRAARRQTAADLEPQAPAAPARRNPAAQAARAQFGRGESDTVRRAYSQCTHRYPG